MAALDPKELLIRAAISALAGVVTTTVLVETADRAPGRRRRKKRKRSGAKKTGAKKKKSPAQREAERRADSPARRASQEIVALPGPGLTVDEFLVSIKTAPSRMTKAIGDVFTRADKAHEIDERTGERERKKSGFETLKEEAFYVAKTAVKDKIVEKTGMGGAISAVEKGADAVKKAGADVAKKIKESVPDDVGEKVAGAGRAISEGGKKLGRAVKEGLPEDAEDVEELKAKLDEKVSGFSRWIEGPGAPNYRRPDSAPDGPNASQKAAVSAREVNGPDDGKGRRVSPHASLLDEKTSAFESGLAPQTAHADDESGIAPAGEGGHHLALDEVMALRAQLDALASGEGAPIADDDGPLDAESTSARAGADDGGRAADAPASAEDASASGTEPSPGVYAPKEGTPKARPILRDENGTRDAEKGALKDTSRRGR
jgi:hypothetical protein